MQVHQSHGSRPENDRARNAFDELDDLRAEIDEIRSWQNVVMLACAITLAIIGGMAGALGGK